MAGLSLVALAVRCSFTGSGSPALRLEGLPSRGTNVLLVTLDTLRADRLGCYGRRAAATPALDALAASGVRFEHAFTTAPLTLPAHASILTGLYPPRHGVRDNGTYRLDEGHETLAELLAQSGHAAAAFVGSFVLDARYGLAQGFAHYDDELAPGTQGDPAGGFPERRGDAVVDAALAWIDAQRERAPEQPFFAWVHLYDVHLPHSAPEPFAARFPGSPYDAEVAFTDFQVGRMVEFLEARGLRGNTLIVAVGDHGEGLGEHGENAHGLLVYDSTMRVPLILSAPGRVPAGVVVRDRAVSTVDVMPTVLELAGSGEGERDGQSLLRPPTRTSRELYMETLYPWLNHGWSPLVALRARDAKYIEAPEPEYYAVDRDPAERANRIAEARAEAAGMSGRLARLRGDDASSSGARVDPDAEALRQLNSLGYASGGRPEIAEGPLPDPKAMVRRWQDALARVEPLASAGRFDEAIEALADALETTPLDAELWFKLGDLQSKADRLEEAVASCERAIELSVIARDEHLLRLAQVHYLRGDRQGLERALAAVRELDPESGGLRLLEAQLAFDAGDAAQALVLCEQARRSDPARSGAEAWALEGDVLAAEARPEEAAAAYAKALAIDVHASGARIGLARLALEAGRWGEVLEQLGPIEARHPSWAEVQPARIRACLALGRPEEAGALVEALLGSEGAPAGALVEAADALLATGERTLAPRCLRAALERDPGHALAHFNLAALLNEAGESEEALVHYRIATLDLRAELLAALVEMARDHRAHGNAEAALATYGQILRLDPAHPEARAESERLRSEGSAGR